MINVTFCAYDKPDNVGGPVAWIQRLLPALRTHGVESRCLVMTHWGDTGPTLAALQAQGFDCPTVACHEHTEDRLRWILARLRENPPDVFVPNLVVAGYLAARWVRSAGIPTVGILHSDDAFYRGLQQQFVFGRREFRLSALVCVSRELEQQVRARRPQHTMTRRIPYGVPLPPQEQRRSPQLRVAYVGRLAEEQKRISEVTRVLCRVVREVPGTEAVLYGDGPDARAVERILATDGAHLPVHLVGRIESDDVQKELLGCDVIILLSDYEGLPIALMEAMACGCVPVCLRMRSGIPELVEDGVTGLLVDNRADSVVAAIRRLRDDSALREQLARAARARIEAEYSSEGSTALWAQLLTQLHAPSGARRVIDRARWMSLPAVDPGLASADVRQPSPMSPAHLYGRGRMIAGRIKRRLLGQALAHAPTVK